MPNRYYTEKDAGELAKCHLTISEVRCHQDDDPDKPCPDCGGEVKLLVETAWGFKAVRESLGEGITISSGHRCRKKQERLFRAAVAKYGSVEEARKHVAEPGGGPHEYSSALDMHTPKSFHTPGEFGKFVWSTLSGDLRMGVYPWGVHMDRAFLLSPNPDPKNYVKGVRWGG